MEDNIRLMLIQTVARSNKYHKRIQELVVILAMIHDPITSDPDARINVEDKEYGFDELLVLIFEFVQLISVFCVFR